MNKGDVSIFSGKIYLIMMIKIIKPTGEEIIIETMKKLEREYSFSTHLIRKYRDTNINILEKDLKKKILYY